MEINAQHSRKTQAETGRTTHALFKAVVQWLPNHFCLKNSKIPTQNKKDNVLFHYYGEVAQYSSSQFNFKKRKSLWADLNVSLPFTTWVLEKLLSKRGWMLSYNLHALAFSGGSSLGFIPPHSLRGQGQPFSWIFLPCFASSRTQWRAHTRQNKTVAIDDKWTELPPHPFPLFVTMETPASWSQEIKKYPWRTIWWTQVLGESTWAKVHQSVEGWRGRVVR